MGNRPSSTEIKKRLREQHEEIGAGEGKRLCDKISTILENINWIDHAEGRIAKYEDPDAKTKKKTSYYAIFQLRAGNKEGRENLRHHLLNTTYQGSAIVGAVGEGDASEWYKITIFGKPGNAHHMTENLLSDLEILLTQVKSFKQPKPF